MSVSKNILMHISHTDSILNSSESTTYIPKPFIQLEELEHARAITNTTPTKEQVKSESYQKGGVMWGDHLMIEIENPIGSIRSGEDPNGKIWHSKMAWDYGEVHATDGNDGDPVDVFIGPDFNSGKVFIIDQSNKDGSFDEHKCMLCFSNQEDAVRGYKDNYEKGWDRILSVTECTAERFQSWVNSRSTSSPASESLILKHP